MSSVYVASGRGGLVKVGFSTNAEQRMITLASQERTSVRLEHAEFVPENARLVERVAHVLLREKRERGEWFDVSVDDAVEAVREAVHAVEEGRGESIIAGARPPGRMFSIRFSDRDMEMLDELRRQEPDIPGRGEMLRRLIARAHEEMLLRDA